MTSYLSIFLLSIWGCFPFLFSVITNSAVENILVLSPVSLQHIPQSGCCWAIGRMHLTDFTTKCFQSGGPNLHSLRYPHANSSISVQFQEETLCPEDGER